MYKIKQIPEDFIVVEENNLLCEEGRYSLIKLKKKNYDTLKALGIIANILHIPIKKIGFAGNKDKYAVTEQYITIENVTQKKIDSIALQDIQLKYVGKIKNRINLGDLEYNYFKIAIRNLDTNFKLDNNKIKYIEEIPNYFGKQRFSTNNSQIGKFIIKDDFKSAVELIIEGSGQAEEDIRKYLKDNKNDYVGAFQSIPKKVQKLYVHAYQSELWNKAAKIYLEQNPKTENIEIPIVGFETELDEYENIEDIYDDIMGEEDITQRDFIIRKIPNLTSEGTTRSLFMKVHDFKFKEDVDELSEKNNKKKITLVFKLKKGCYATTLISYLFD